jgi:O-antigen ligase
MVLLASALGPAFKGANFVLWGFLASAIIVQSTLSRAGLAMFGAGAIGVLGLSVLEKPTARRLGMTASMAVVGALGLLLTIDTIIARFNDSGNTASSELRQVMNQACREMAADRAMGIGWNNYALVVNPPYPYAEPYYEWNRGRGMKVDESKPNAVVESHYYLLLGETGYPGLISYLFMILVGLWYNFRALLFFPHSFRRCLALGIGTGCALNYVQSTLERVLVQPRNLMLWMILFGITARLEVMRREARAARTPTKA